MGAWGDGNLDNDGARDACADLSDELFGRISELLNDRRVHQADDDPFYEFCVKVEAVLALDQRDMISSPPSVRVPESLLDRFLSEWEAYSQPSTERNAAMVNAIQEFRNILNNGGDEGVENGSEETTDDSPCEDRPVTLADLMGDDAPD